MEEKEMSNGYITSKDLEREGALTGVARQQEEQRQTLAMERLAEEVEAELEKEVVKTLTKKKSKQKNVKKTSK